MPHTPELPLLRRATFRAPSARPDALPALDAVDGERFDPPAVGKPAVPVAAESSPVAPQEGQAPAPRRRHPPPQRTHGTRPAEGPPANYGLPAEATTLEGFLFPATYTLDPG
ncbi:hypothetical protein, partial [Agromyces humi]|uniref:hypothetical protein n=1 Tax=Agromyces humi TaxID=1766800 RepID=UPI00193ADA78